MHLFIVLTTGILILKYMFINYMYKEYKITNSEFKKIKSKTKNKSIYFFIILFIFLYLVVEFKYNIYIILIVLVISVWEFIYGLTKIKELDEHKYTLYYIVEELISFLILLSVIVLIIFS